MTEFEEVVEVFRLRAAACKGPHVPECDCNVYKVLSQVEVKDCMWCDNYGKDCNMCDELSDKDREIDELEQERDAAVARAEDAEEKLDALTSKSEGSSEKPACLGISTCGGCDPACPSNG